MTDALRNISTRQTVQTKQADPAQVRNDAGGYAFVADDLNILRRFLATGVEGGTYYVGEKEQALRASDHLLGLIRTRPADVLATVLDMSERGATVKQQPLMFTLAALTGSEDIETRKAALVALPRIARTASHLFLYASYVEQFRGWGKGLRKAVARWYDEMPLDRLAYQIEKYGSREGFTHRDLMLLAHVGSTQSKSGTEDPTRRALYARAAGKEVVGKEYLTLPQVARLSQRLSEVQSVDETVEVIRSTESVSWEMVQSEYLADKRVWEALLDGGHVPITALLRNLARLTANGTLDPFGQDDRTARVIGRLRDPEVLAKGRVHPMSVLLAAATYKAGRSLRGSSTWHPIPNIEKALDAGFMAAIPGITPEPDVKVMIGCDVSGSMDGGSVGGLPLTPRDAAGALAMALAAQFPSNMGVAFTGSGGWSGNNTLTPINLDPQRRVVDLIAEMKSLSFGRTDCSLPILYALDAMNKGASPRIDAFVILTDNETWAGNIHPHQALRQYRERTGIPARMVTVSMTYNHSTIADPKDPLMLDVVGLDSNVVSLVGDFIAGRV